MTGIAKLSLFCPPMPVSAVNLKLRRTAAEPMTATIDFADGTVLIIQNVIIPPTDVHRKSILHWQVDACVGEGKDLLGNRIEVHLPIEPVLFDLATFSMIAKAITAPVTLTLANGQVATGSVVFPDCHTNIMTGVAEAITAVGRVEFP